MSHHVIPNIRARCQQYVERWRRTLSPKTCSEPLTLKAVNALLDHYALNDFLSYGCVDDTYSGLWLDDDPKQPNSFLLGYSVTPLIVAGDKATDKLEKLINRLPAGCVIQSVAQASNNIEDYLENWVVSRRGSRQGIFDLITQRRVQHMLDWCQGRRRPMARGSRYAPRTLQHYLFVRIPARFTQITEETIQDFLEQVDKIHNTVVSQLQSVHLPVTRLSGSALALLVKQFINPHIASKHHRELGVNAKQSLAPQLIPRSSSYQTDDDGALIFTDKRYASKRYTAVMTVNRHHDTEPHRLSSMQHCLGSMLDGDDFIPGEFTVFSIIEKQAGRQRIKDFARKLANAEWHTSVNNRVFQNLFRRHHQLKQHLYDFIDKVKHGAGATKVISGMVLTTETPSLLEDACAHAESAWSAAGMELVREYTISFPMWLASLPGQYVPRMDGVGRGLQRGVTMTTLNAATLMHVQGDWTGSHPADGGLLLLTRRGTLATLNLFKTFKSNFNALVAASSGSGKSFLIADWVSDFLARQGSVRVIDAGRSYYNLAEVVAGQNVVCDDSAALCFNIFSTLTSKEILDESLTMLTRLVAQMCFPAGYTHDQATDKKPWEESFIGYVIETLWKDKRDQLSILDIYHYCEAHQADDPRIKDLLMLLHKWAKGHHAKWFVGQWNIDFDNPFIVFELDELKKDKDLQNVILNLLLARMTDEMYYAWRREAQQEGGITPKAIIIDEAWDLLSRPNTASFIEEAARRIRKYSGSIIIITQSFMDMNRHSAAQAFVQNCNWLISLVQDIGTVKQAVDQGLINFKDYALDILDSLRKTDDYSELYILNKSVKGEGVYRLVVDPASYWTYTTDGAERSRLAALVAEGHSIPAAIDTLSQSDGQVEEDVVCDTNTRD